MAIEAKTKTIDDGELRSTETLYLRVRPEVRARVLVSADQFGVSASEYVSALVMGEKPRARIAAEAGRLAILGQRVVAALNALPREAVEASMELASLRKAIIETLLEHRSNYDAQLDRRGAEGRWA